MSKNSLYIKNRTLKYIYLFSLLFFLNFWWTMHILRIVKVKSMNQALQVFGMLKLT